MKLIKIKPHGPQLNADRSNWLQLDALEKVRIIDQPSRPWALVVGVGDAWWGPFALENI